MQEVSEAKSIFVTWFVRDPITERQVCKFDFNLENLF